MSTPARTPAAGLPGPVWPSRPVPPTVPSTTERVEPWGARAPRAGTAPAARTRPGAHPAAAAPARPPAAPARPAVPVAAAAPAAPLPAQAAAPAAEAAAAEIPAAEAPLDPRTIARASLAAGNNRSLWWTMSGIVASVVTAFALDAVVGTYALAALLLVFAVVRAVVRGAGPTAITVRSKPLDVLVLAGSAATLVVLASVLPPS